MKSAASPGPGVPGEGLDVWSILDRSITQSAQPADRTDEAQPESEAKREPPWKSFTWRVWFWASDIVGLLTWTYVLLKLFVVDIDRVILDATVPSATPILDYRLLFVMAGAAILALLFWRWKTALFLTYVALFPLVVVFWKAPWFVAKRRSWMTFMVALNTVGDLFRNLRYQLVSKSIWIVAAAVILLFSNDYVLAVAAVCLSFLLVWSAMRVMADSLRSSWFLKVQEDLISKIVGSSFMRSLTTLDESDLPTRSDVILSEHQVNSVVSKIQGGAIVNRALYAWAYRLQRYRQSQLTLILNGAAYISLFIGSALTFALLNLALLKIAPGQYDFVEHPSTLAMCAYGISTLFWSSAGGVTASGDVAHLLVISAGLFGPLYLAGVVVNAFFALKREREETALEETVQRLRERARRQEAEFRAGMRVGIQEACDRLNALGKVGMLAFIERLTEGIPPDFLDQEP